MRRRFGVSHPQPTPVHDTVWRAPIEVALLAYRYPSRRRGEPRTGTERCFDPTLCKQRTKMAPVGDVESTSRSHDPKNVVCGRGETRGGSARPRLRTPPAFTPRRSGRAAFASVARGRKAVTALRPCQGTKLVPRSGLCGSRFHTRTTHAPASSWSQSEDESSGPTAPFAGVAIGPSHDLSSIQSYPRASSLGRATPRIESVRRNAPTTRQGFRPDVHSSTWQSSLNLNALATRGDQHVFLRVASGLRFSPAV